MERELGRRAGSGARFRRGLPDRLTLTLVGLAVAALSACAEKDEAAADAPRGAPIPYGEVKSFTKQRADAAGELVWDYDGQGAHVLARGAPEAVVLEAIFRCEDNGVGVGFAVFEPGPPPATVRLTSGSASNEYAIRPIAPDLSVNDAWTLAGDVPPADPVMRNFLETGRLTRWYGEEAAVWDARSDDERKAIRTFAEACGAKL